MAMRPEDVIRLKRIYVSIPRGMSYHKAVKGAAVAYSDPWRRCVFCKHYPLNIIYDADMKCYKCLSTAELDSFAVDRKVRDSDWYRMEEPPK